MANSAPKDNVQVLYALRDEQFIVELPFEAGRSAVDYVRKSGLLERHPEIQLSSLALGVFGKSITLEYVARQGDRIEICRPLQRDPRTMRHELWAEGKVIGGKDVSSSGAKG